MGKSAGVGSPSEDRAPRRGGLGVGAGLPWPRPGPLARALESLVVEACSHSRTDGLSRALSDPWVLAALCAVPSELARVAFEESGRSGVPEQSSYNDAAARRSYIGGTQSFKSSNVH